MSEKGTGFGDRGPEVDMPIPLADLLQEKKLEFARQYKLLQRKKELLDSIPQLDNIQLELEVFDLWDGHSRGQLSYADLVSGLSLCSGLVEGLSPGDLEAAREAVLLDAGGQQANAGMDRAAFGRLLEYLVSKAGGTMQEWVSLLVMQWQPPVPQHAAPGDKLLEASVAEAAADGRMRNLFALFDMNMDAKVSFKEVAIGLRKISPQVTLNRAAQAAVEVLLWYDRNHDRSLDYMEFVHFICAFCHAGNLEFGQVADALILAAARDDPSPEEQQWLEEQLAQLDHVHFDDARMQKIFDLYDTDGDGSISFKALCLALHKFEPTKPLAGTVEYAAQLVRQSRGLAAEPGANTMEAEGEGEGADVACCDHIDRGQFASVLSHFVEESGADFNQVADYLVAISAAAPDDAQGAALPGWFFTKIFTSERRADSAQELQGQDMA